ncbi:16279_t:CDS:1, partial [Racocetra persica]
MKTIDMNFEYWVITPTDNWNTLDFTKAWLDCKYSKNKGTAIKALREQLNWYKFNSFDKEKAKAQELLEEIP